MKMKIILINAAKQQCSSFNYIDCEGSKPFSNTFSSRWWTFSRFHWSDLKKDSSSSLFIKTKRHEHIEAFDTSGLYGCRNLMWRPGCPHSWRVLVHQCSTQSGSWRVNDDYDKFNQKILSKIIHIKSLYTKPVRNEMESQHIQYSVHWKTSFLKKKQVIGWGYICTNVPSKG